MALMIYRRHDPGCKVHKLKLKLREKRFYQDCNCWIWLTGTTDKERYPRQALKLRDWKAAEARLRSLTVEAMTDAHGPSLKDCAQRFTDAHTTNVTPKVLAQYETLL